MMMDKKIIMLCLGIVIVVCMGFAAYDILGKSLHRPVSENHGVSVTTPKSIDNKSRSRVSEIPVVSATTTKPTGNISLEKSEKRPKGRTNEIDGAEVVFVPKGFFSMGMSKANIKDATTRNPDLTENGYKDEIPNRKVFLDGYWIYKYPVTVAQYQRFSDASGYKMPSPPSGGWKYDHPIVNITTYEHALAYANWAGARLPTEAEWEKAARGADGRIYPWGNVWDRNKCSISEDGHTTVKVGIKPSGASPYGVMDMLGYSWEWCSDWYDASYYASMTTNNPHGPSHGRYHVLRGGFDRCTRRGYGDRDGMPVYDVGFRCVLINIK